MLTNRCGDGSTNCLKQLVVKLLPSFDNELLQKINHLRSKIGRGGDESTTSGNVSSVSKTSYRTPSYSAEEVISNSNTLPPHGYPHQRGDSLSHDRVCKLFITVWPVPKSALFP